MKITDLIAAFIRETLEKTDGVAELSRSELAKQFDCAPSQINYVIATRFSPEHGYLVESRRGGGGYIRVVQAACDCDAMATHALCGIGETIDPLSVRAVVANLEATDVLSAEQARMIEAATSDAALRPAAPDTRDALRAGIFKSMLLRVICFPKEGRSE